MPRRVTVQSIPIDEVRPVVVPYTPRLKSTTTESRFHFCHGCRRFEPNGEDRHMKRRGRRRKKIMDESIVGPIDVDEEEEEE